MRPVLATVTLALSACGGWAPPDFPPAATCDFTPFESPPAFRTLPAAPICSFTPGGALPCRCEDYTALYGGQTPPGVWDPFCGPGDPSPTCPGISPPGVPDAGFIAVPGCKPWLLMAAPWCSQNAELSGQLAKVGTMPDFSGAATSRSTRSWRR